MDFSLLRTLEALLRESRDVIVSWFSIITQRQRALERVNLGDGKVLLYALRFLLYMTAAELIIRIPATAARESASITPGTS